MLIVGQLLVNSYNQVKDPDVPDLNDSSLMGNILSNLQIDCCSHYDRSHHFPHFSLRNPPISTLFHTPIKVDKLPKNLLHTRNTPGPHRRNQQQQRHAKKTHSP